MLGLFVVIKPVKRIISYIKVKTKGKRISGKVYGYVLSPWGTKLQEEYVAKILIETPGGRVLFCMTLEKITSRTVLMSRLRCWRTKIII